MTFGDFHLSGARADNLTAMIPVLPSRDIRASKRLYESLGFTCVIASPTGDYLIIRRDWVELHFWRFADLDPMKNAVSAYLRVADVETAAAVFLSNGSPPPSCHFTPPADKPWGMREAHFIDPDGNLLNIGSPLDPSRWTQNV